VPRQPRSRRAALVFAPLAALALAGSLAGCSTGTTSSGNGNPNGDGFIAGSGSGGLLKTRVEAPAVTGASLTGGPAISLQQYAGKVLVVNFYGSWCSPCRAESPLLEAAATANPQVQFLGVLMQDSTANGLAFRRTFGITYPSIVDPDGTVIAKFREVNPDAVPDTFVIDKTGKIAAKYVGPVTNAAAFAKVLATLEAEPA